MKRFAVLVSLLAMLLPIVGHGQQPGPATNSLASQFPIALAQRVKVVAKDGSAAWLMFFRSEYDDRLAVEILKLKDGELVSEYWQIMPVGSGPIPPAPGPTPPVPPVPPPTPPDDAQAVALAAAMKVPADVRTADCPRLAALYKATSPTIGTQITTFAQWAAVTRSARQQMIADPKRLATWETWSDELSKWLATRADNYKTPAAVKGLNDALQAALEKAAKQ